MTYAATGFYLEIDLSRGSIDRVAGDPDDTMRFLGGQGWAAHTIWERVPPETDPLSPKNLLIFTAGLLCATPVSGASRTGVSTISPQTNRYVHSGFSGFFAPELKHAGYDAIVIRGKSPHPVYLFIINDRVELRDASHLAGRPPLETADLIRKELKNQDLQVAAIGLAGENRVSLASIEHGNSSATRGVGAVMGDKGLKAVAVRGTQDIAVARPAELFEQCSAIGNGLADNPHCGDILLNEQDSAIVSAALECDGIAVRGFRAPELQRAWHVAVEREHVYYQWENYSQEMEEIHETVTDRSRLLRGTGCFNCVKDCHQAVSLPGERIYFLKNYGRLAYTMAAHGDLPITFDLLARFQEYGLDESATLEALACAESLYDAGGLTEQQLSGIPADRAERFNLLTGLIARREGFGAMLADGIAGAEPVRQLPGNPVYRLMYATGGRMNITQIEGSFPRAPLADRQSREAFAASWEAAPQQFREWYTAWEPGQQLPVEAAVAIADWNEAMHCLDDSLGICPLLSSFRGQYGGQPPYHRYNLPHLVSSATGLDMDTDRLMEISRRSRQLIRAINIRRGLTRGDEQGDQSDGLLDAYYEFRGWTGDGVPTRGALDELGLGCVSDDLIQRGLLPDR